jgi:MoaA/NifB/PqqE/SkfB family radical SAM enzyme
MMSLETPAHSIPSLEYFDQNPLTFLWIELTNRCNLRCVHCYSESTPSSIGRDILTDDDYTRVIREGAIAGCTQLQFIGGEPTLHPRLPEFIDHAKNNGYTFVEVYTNLTHLTPRLLDCFVRHGVHIATSVYSHKPEIHDRITTVAGSHARTVANTASCIKAGLTVRAAVVLMEANRSDIDMTRQFLIDMGVSFVGSDRIRSVGRGQSEVKISSGSDLCGKCWQGSLCVGPDGMVSPCIMSKDTCVGSIRTESLGTIARSEAIKRFRRKQGTEITVNNGVPVATCNPNCNPSCEPVCNPRCGPQCDPTRCQPTSHCNPYLYT